jgi:putative transposase
MGGRRTIEVKRRRHTPEQIVRKLREADRLLAEGSEVPEAAKALEVSEPTYHRWRAQFGGMRADDVKRLKELERENAQLKRLFADKELENSGAQRETGEPVAPAPGGPDAPGSSPRLGAAGVPDRRAASLHPAP